LETPCALFSNDWKARTPADATGAGNAHDRAADDVEEDQSAVSINNWLWPVGGLVGVERHGFLLLFQISVTTGTEVTDRRVLEVFCRATGNGSRAFHRFIKPLPTL
jgi:hypothetical protein